MSWPNWPQGAVGHPAVSAPVPVQPVPAPAPPSTNFAAPVATATAAAATAAPAMAYAPPNIGAAPPTFTAAQYAALSPEQQYAMQQNWQQWQTYHQQYAQWHAQYGEQYQREMQAKLGATAPPLPFAPATAQYTAPVPPTQTAYTAPPPLPDHQMSAGNNSNLNSLAAVTAQPPPPPPPLEKDSTNVKLPSLLDLPTPGMGGPGGDNKFNVWSGNSQQYHDHQPRNQGQGFHGNSDGQRNQGQGFQGGGYQGNQSKSGFQGDQSSAGFEGNQGSSGYQGNQNSFQGNQGGFQGNQDNPGRRSSQRQFDNFNDRRSFGGGGNERDQDRRNYGGSGDRDNFNDNNQDRRRFSDNSRDNSRGNNRDSNRSNNRDNSRSNAARDNSRDTGRDNNRNMNIWQQNNDQYQQQQQQQQPQQQQQQPYPLQQQFQQQRQPPQVQEPDSKDPNNQNRSIESIMGDPDDGKTREERAFDEQFRKWEEEFERWKKQNANHPDRVAYREYEMKFEDCRRKLLERREQMRIRKQQQQPPAPVQPLLPPPQPNIENFIGPQVPPQPPVPVQLAQVPIQIAPPPIQMVQPPIQIVPAPPILGQLAAAQPAPIQQQLDPVDSVPVQTLPEPVKTQSIEIENQPDMDLVDDENDEQERKEVAAPAAEGEVFEFLKTTKSEGGGIPGLDLVPPMIDENQDEQDEGKLDEDVTEVINLEEEENRLQIQQQMQKHKEQQQQQQQLQQLLQPPFQFPPFQEQLQQDNEQFRNVQREIPSLLSQKFEPPAISPRGSHASQDSHSQSANQTFQDSMSRPLSNPSIDLKSNIPIGKDVMDGSALPQELSGIASALANTNILALLSAALGKTDNGTGFPIDLNSIGGGGGGDRGSQISPWASGADQLQGRNFGNNFSQQNMGFQQGNNFNQNRQQNAPWANSNSMDNNRFGQNQNWPNNNNNNRNSRWGDNNDNNWNNGRNNNQNMQDQQNFGDRNNDRGFDGNQRGNRQSRWGDQQNFGNDSNERNFNQNNFDNNRGGNNRWGGGGGNGNSGFDGDRQGRNFNQFNNPFDDNRNNNRNLNQFNNMNDNRNRQQNFDGPGQQQQSDDIDMRANSIDRNSDGRDASRDRSRSSDSKSDRSSRNDRDDRKRFNPFKDSSGPAAKSMNRMDDNNRFSGGSMDQRSKSNSSQGNRNRNDNRSNDQNSNNNNNNLGGTRRNPFKNKDGSMGRGRDSPRSGGSQKQLQPPPLMGGDEFFKPTQVIDYQNKSLGSNNDQDGSGIPPPPKVVDYGHKKTGNDFFPMKTIDYGHSSGSGKSEDKVKNPGSESGIAHDKKIEEDDEEPEEVDGGDDDDDDNDNGDDLEDDNDNIEQKFDEDEDCNDNFNDPEENDDAVIVADDDDDEDDDDGGDDNDGECNFTRRPGGNDGFSAGNPGFGGNSGSAGNSSFGFNRGLGANDNFDFNRGPGGRDNFDGNRGFGDGGLGNNRGQGRNDGFGTNRRPGAGGGGGTGAGGNANRGSRGNIDDDAIGKYGQLQGQGGGRNRNRRRNKNKWSGLDDNKIGNLLIQQETLCFPSSNYNDKKTVPGKNSQQKFDENYLDNLQEKYTPEESFEEISDEDNDFNAGPVMNQCSENYNDAEKILTTIFESVPIPVPLSSLHSKNSVNIDKTEIFKENLISFDHSKSMPRSTEIIPVEKSVDMQKIFPSLENNNTITIDEILLKPGRESRPKKIVIILRGPPGSGKTYVAKLIKENEVTMGGSAPRILSIDDYFMSEIDKEEVCQKTGRKIIKKEMLYEYEKELEENYNQCLMKSFKKTIDSRLFDFIIVDNINHKLRVYTEFYNLAKDSHFTPYTIDLKCDMETCLSNNIHNRSEQDIKNILDNWSPTPNHYIKLDITSMLQSAAIPEVEMEDISDGDDDLFNGPDNTNLKDNDAQNETETCGFLKSKWDSDPSEAKLARLDGTSKPLQKSTTLEDYLQIDGWEPPISSSTNKKRVRWADIEEKRVQDKMRAIGFVVGHTDWNRMMDPTSGSGALTKTKYIEKIKR